MDRTWKEVKEKCFDPYSWNISTIIYNESIDVVKARGCNGYVATNIGDTAVRVNGQLLLPGTPGTILGDSVSMIGNQGEIYKGRIDIQFQAPLGANPAIELIQKFYTEFI